MAHPIDAARRPRWRLAFALPLLLGTLSCALFVRRPLVPMRTVELAEKTGGDCLAVLLPGRYDEPESFRRAGFAEAVERRALKLDLLGVDSHLGYFRDRSIVERLRLDVIQPARAAGYRTIWIVGTSLGGLGGLLYLHEHADDLSGVLALAPYLGDDDVIREIKAAGGPTRWTPPSPLPADQVGRELWSWLGPWAAHP